MRISLSWLSRFLKTDAGIHEIADALNAIGLEVESVADRSQGLDSFIVGEVKKVEKHPNADKLNFCHIDDGREILDIVTGAQNVRTGLKVAIAPVGSTVPSSGIKIEKRKLRGVESNGMLCSRSELGLSDDGSDGIMELPDDAKIGSKLIDVLPELSDSVLEISVTPNRSDCLSIYGVARDLSAYGIGELKELEYTSSIFNNIKDSSTEATTQNTAEVESGMRYTELEISKGIIEQAKVANSKDCPLFILRNFTNVTNQESPDWLKSLLLSIDENPISALVDITNYINYSFARPLHVYDADKVSGDIVVRNAENGENFIGLDHKEYALSKDDLVIADKEKILGLAGIIGGEGSKCELSSKNIYLEAAVFEPVKIARTARRLNINTDAKHKFERGVDHNFTFIGAVIASDMIKTICGGNANDFLIVGSREIENKKLTLRLKRIKDIGGVSISLENAVAILTKLGFKDIAELQGESIEMTVPSWRHDITHEEDMVEELLRIYGYDKIPEESISSDKSLNAYRIPPNDKALEHARISLASQGYHELITWSFMSSNIAKVFGLFKNSLLIKNPISSDLDILRGSALPNLLGAIHKNNLRSFENLSFFEIGPAFNSGEVGDQLQAISAIRSGLTSEENIYKDSRKFDFFDAKRTVIDLLAIWNIHLGALEISRESIPHYYHPAKAAIFKLDGKVIAQFGEMHPIILEAMKIVSPTVGLEIFVGNISTQKPHHSDLISDYQKTLRDFAFIVNDKTEVGSIVKAIKSVNSELIRDIRIFDVYKGKELEDNKKSIAVKVTLQAVDRTLTNEDILAVSDKIISSVEQRTGGVLRTV